MAINRGRNASSVAALMEIFERVQQRESDHQRSIVDASDIYKQMQHNEFIDLLKKILKRLMSVDAIDNQFSHAGLKFLARFAVTSKKSEDTQNIHDPVFNFIIKTTSPKYSVRVYLCVFLEYFVKYARILGVELKDDDIIDRAIEFMNDAKFEVRKAALKVIMLYQEYEGVADVLIEHLIHDGVALIRLEIIRGINFTDETIPHILDRLRDVNESVRCIVYANLAQKNVRTIKILHRLQILNEARTETSERIQQVISQQLISNWLEIYDNNYLQLLAAVRFDATEEDIVDFISIAKYIITKQLSLNAEHGRALVKQMGFRQDGIFSNCLPFNSINLDSLVCWLMLIQFENQNNDIGYGGCDVETYCKMLTEFVRSQPTDIEFKIQIMVDILNELEFDEYGKIVLIDFIAEFLKKSTHLNESSIMTLVKCAAKCMEKDALEHYFGGILEHISGAKASFFDQKMNDVKSQIENPEQQVMIAQIRRHILELREMVEIAVKNDDFPRIRLYRREIMAQYSEFLDHFTPADANVDAYVLSKEEAKKFMQIYFYCGNAIRSKSVRPCTAPADLIRLHDFVSEQFSNEDFELVGWSLKCGGSMSLAFGAFSNATLEKCYQQLITTENTEIWSIAIRIICEILDYHRINFILGEGEENERNILVTFYEFLEMVNEQEVKDALVVGLCRLILSEYIVDKNRIAAVLIEYFNPAAFSSTTQIMSVFLGKLVEMKRQACLVTALQPMVEIIENSPYEKQYYTIDVSQIFAFVIKATEPAPPANTSKWHNQITIEIFRMLHKGYGTPIMSSLLAQLVKLKVEINPEFREEIRVLILEVVTQLKSTLPVHLRRHIDEFASKFKFTASSLRKAPAAAIAATAATTATTSRGSRANEGATASSNPVQNDENAMENKIVQPNETGRLRRALGNLHNTKK